MNYYENIIILDTSQDEEKMEESLKRITDTIEKFDGAILKQEKWGRRRLAYEVNKHKNGFFIFLVFQAPPNTIKALENLYKILDSVVKYMFIKLRKQEIDVLEKDLQSQQDAQQENKEELENKESGTPDTDSTDGGN